MRAFVVQLIGWWVVLQQPRRDQRGLSQSTENAILLAGAVLIAGTVISLVGKYVSTHLPK